MRSHMNLDPRQILSRASGGGVFRHFKTAPTNYRNTRWRLCNWGMPMRHSWTQPAPDCIYGNIQVGNHNYIMSQISGMPLRYVLTEEGPGMRSPMRFNH